ncbi:MAG: hypothetical protein JKY44_11235 [Flavobacteriaceae bacterium]|nr:hypothetical protein [Flavobacteriaceae bacterium]
MGTNQIIIKNALKIVLGIVIYFFAMKLFGLDTISELRFLNFLFVVWGINSAIKNNIQKNKDTFYISNLFIGVSTSVIAVGMIIIGLITYVSLIDPGFINVLEKSFLWGSNLTLPLIIFAIAIEGIASSVICSFILMQYWKNYKIEDYAV